MANDIKYIQHPRVESVTLSEANRNVDGTGALVLFTAGNFGSKINDVVIQAWGPTSQGVIRLYLGDGMITSCVAQIEVKAVTGVDAVLKPFSAALSASAGAVASALPFDIPVGMSLLVSSQTSDAFNVFAFGGDYGS